MGRITCQFFQKQAPKAVANFIGLAEGTIDWTDPTTNLELLTKTETAIVGLLRSIEDGENQGEIDLGRGALRDVRAAIRTNAPISALPLFLGAKEVHSPGRSSLGFWDRAPPDVLRAATSSGCSMVPLPLRRTGLVRGTPARRDQQSKPLCATLEDKNNGLVRRVRTLTVGVTVSSGTAPQWSP